MFVLTEIIDYYIFMWLLSTYVYTEAVLGLPRSNARRETVLMKILPSYNPVIPGIAAAHQGVISDGFGRCARITHVLMVMVRRWHVTVRRRRWMLLVVVQGWVRWKHRLLLLERIVCWVLIQNGFFRFRWSANYPRRRNHRVFGHLTDWGSSCSGFRWRCNAIGRV